MGYDADANSAVLLEPSTFRFLFASNNFSKAVAKRLLKRYRDRFSDIGEKGHLKVYHIWVEDSTEDDFDDRGMVLERMESVTNGYQLYTLLVDCIYAQQSGEVHKYGNTYIDTDVILEMWDEVIGLFNFVTDEKVPQFADIISFGSYRNSGLYSIELGHPYFRIDEDTVFERKLSDSGASLQQFMNGELEVSEWVESSN